MPIVRYDPFRDLRTLQEEVNRLFSNNLGHSFGEEGIARSLLMDKFCQRGDVLGFAVKSIPNQPSEVFTRKRC